MSPPRASIALAVRRPNAQYGRPENGKARRRDFPTRGSRVTYDLSQLIPQKENVTDEEMGHATVHAPDRALVLRAPGEKDLARTSIVEAALGQQVALRQSSVWPAAWNLSTTKSRLGKRSSGKLGTQRSMNLRNWQASSCTLVLIPGKSRVRGARKAARCVRDSPPQNSSTPNIAPPPS